MQKRHSVEVFVKIAPTILSGVRTFKKIYFYSEKRGAKMKQKRNVHLKMNLFDLFSIVYLFFI